MENVNSLAEFVANYPLTGEESIFRYTDIELYELYASIRSSQLLKGSTLTQNFMAEVGRMEPKALHSFVSKNPITNVEFKNKIVKLLYVLGESPESANLQRTIQSDFPKTIFTKSPNRHVSLKLPPENTNLVTALRQELSAKEDECKSLNIKLISAANELCTKDEQLSSMKDEISKYKEEIASLKLIVAERDGAISILNESVKHHRQVQLQAKRPPFNRFA